MLGNREWTRINANKGNSAARRFSIIRVHWFSPLPMTAASTSPDRLGPFAVLNQISTPIPGAAQDENSEGGMAAKRRKRRKKESSRFPPFFEPFVLFCGQNAFLPSAGRLNFRARSERESSRIKGQFGCLSAFRYSRPLASIRGSSSSVSPKKTGVFAHRKKRRRKTPVNFVERWRYFSSGAPASFQPEMPAERCFTFV
jgi:hypothetical protein